MGKAPEHIMEQAREVAVSIGSDSLREDTLTIAEALYEAEKRGFERGLEEAGERELVPGLWEEYRARARAMGIINDE